MTSDNLAKHRVSPCVPGRPKGGYKGAIRDYKGAIGHQEEVAREAQGVYKGKKGLIREQ